MIQKLLSSAVGLETKRGDSITVSSSSFAAVPDTPLPPFWQKAWLPGLAQPLAALAIFLAGLFFGLRPLLKAMTAQKTGAETMTESDMGLTRKTKPLNGDDIAAYHEKMTAIQNFVRSDEARASLALREMLHGSARNTAHE
jgi:flagellar biosynthesis/type III secretory pathway M-ring protein FliF/YscJ